MLAEDNPINQRVAERLLQKLGHHVFIAIDGCEALEAATTQEPFDLILMDIQMPRMDGIEATQAIRKLEDPARRNMPIVALTAFAMKGDRERCLAAGMNGYISKPIHPHEFCATVEHFVTAPRREF